MFSCTQEAIDEIPKCNAKSYLSIENNRTLDIVVQEICDSVPCGEALRAKPNRITVFEIEAHPDLYYFSMIGIVERQLIIGYKECDTTFLIF